MLASNKTIFAEDTERGIQDAYQQPTTEGMRKYGKRLITPSRIHEYAGYAFRQLRSGVPKPVHLDFPAEIANARFRDPSEIEYFFDKTQYRTETRPHPDPRAIDRAFALLRDAERPIIVSSNGVFHSRAWAALRRLAERAHIPVVESGATKGQFPADHELSADTAPGALASADLVLLVGQYCMPTLGEFAFGPDARYIRIDPCAEDIGRNLPIDLGIVSDERAALEALADGVPRMRHEARVAEVAAARTAFEAQNAEYYQTGLGYADAVHPSVIGKELADFLHRGALPPDRTTIVQGGYGIARYTRRYLRAFRPGQIMNGAYQYGAIGPDVGYTVGVAAAVRQGTGPQADYQGHPVIAITGDAGFGYTGMEMETLSKYRLPAVVIVYNNNAWGTWNGQVNNTVGLPVHLFQENIRYDKMGEALGAHGEYVTRPSEFRPALERAYQVALDESRPSVVNVQAKKEFWLRDQYAPGFLGKIEPGVMSYYIRKRHRGVGIGARPFAGACAAQRGDEGIRAGRRERGETAAGPPDRGAVAGRRAAGASGVCRPAGLRGVQRALAGGGPVPLSLLLAGDGAARARLHASERDVRLPGPAAQRPGAVGPVRGPRGVRGGEGVDPAPAPPARRPAPRPRPVHRRSGRGVRRARRDAELSRLWPESSRQPRPRDLSVPPGVPAGVPVVELRRTGRMSAPENQQ